MPPANTAGTASRASPARPVGRTPVLHRLENAVSILILSALALLPLIEIAGRRSLGAGVPGSILIVQHLTLAAAFVGAALASRSGKLLALSASTMLPERLRPAAKVFWSGVGVAISVWLARAGLVQVQATRQAGDVLAMGIPLWLVEASMPAALAVVAARLAWRASGRWAPRAAAASCGAAGLILESAPWLAGSGILLPGLAIVMAATLAGLPIFAAIGGVALLLFFNDGIPTAAVPVEALRLTTMSVLPAVPLFTLSGYLLAAGGASERLVKVFDAVVGWLPGGAAIVTTLVFAFFTSFTGASGVTILTLGGLLLPVLVRSGYPESFAVGLITVSGSIGLLFPPSLPVILYGVNSMQPIDTLFLAGLVPGTLLVLLVSALGVRQGMAAGAARKPFSARSAYHAVREAGWELLLPVVVLVGIFGGFATLVEAAALTVLYAFFVECFVYKDLSIRRDLAGVVVDAAALIGGFLIILGVALGLTNYLIDAEVPTRLLDWMQQHIESRAMFLLMLNVFLIGVGAIMDIYSALFVVVPLIIPLGEAYGIHPVHLGIIFLANLELGYLTPPMGENLFLSSYRFGHPVLRVFRFTLPFYAVVAAGVLLITYLPFMTLGLIDP